MDKTENKFVWEKPEIFDMQLAADATRCCSHGDGPVTPCLCSLPGSSFVPNCRTGNFAAS